MKLSALFCKIFPQLCKPVPITPPSPPIPPYSSAWVNFALTALNNRRTSKGLGALALDGGLCRAANILAIGIANGTMAPHQDFPERVRAEGWPYENKGIRNSGFGNVSEGCSEGGTTPEECVLILDSSTDPNEGHRRDFEDPAFNHVGISICPITAGTYSSIGGYVCVVDYGAR